MDAVRTPDDRFRDLPGYAFAPHYLDVGAHGLRLHYLDEGKGPDVALCLHGQPTWSYLYRKMIPAFRAAGLRVIAPDLFGFGRSDKPVDDAVYTIDFHRRTLLAFIEALDLRRMTLVVQDWGGLLGLTLPMAMPARFDRLLIMNTGFGTGDVPLDKGFLAWREFSRAHPDMDIAALMRRAVPCLSDAEAAAYAAPFPDVRHKAGVRRFPDLVPEFPTSDGAAVGQEARAWFALHWRKPSFMAIGMQDPVLGPPAMRLLHGLIPLCPPPLELPEAGHFVQEAGPIIVERALESFAAAAHHQHAVRAAGTNA